MEAMKQGRTSFLSEEDGARGAFGFEESLESSEELRARRGLYVGDGVLPRLTSSLLSSITSESKVVGSSS